MPRTEAWSATCNASAILIVLSFQPLYLFSHQNTSPLANAKKNWLSYCFIASKAKRKGDGEWVGEGPAGEILLDRAGGRAHDAELWVLPGGEATCLSKAPENPELTPMDRDEDDSGSCGSFVPRKVLGEKDQP